MKNFKTLEAGKKYRAANGWVGVAENRDNPNGTYPIIVKFEDNWFTYTIDGFYHSNKREDEYNIVECLDVETPESIQAEIERLQAKLEELKKDEPMKVDESWLNGNNGIKVRANGEYKDKGFYLNSSFNWEIVTDSIEIKVLIPKRN